MSQYNNLRASIDANIRQNGQQAITGEILNAILKAMVDSLGVGYQYAGVALPNTNPGNTDSKVFYIAMIAGEYSHFGNIVVNSGEVALLKYDNTWTKEVTGIGQTSSFIKSISAKSGFVSMGVTLESGKTYAIRYQFDNYAGQLYYIELYGAGSAGTIIEGSTMTSGAGVMVVTPSIDATQVRIGVGGGTLPNEAETTLDIYELVDINMKIGELSELETLSKDNLVKAINEVFDITQEMQKTLIGTHRMVGNWDTLDFNIPAGDYEIQYNISGISNNVYYIALYTIGGVSKDLDLDYPFSSAAGKLSLTLDDTYNAIRLGLGGSGTLPEGAVAEFSFYKLKSYATKQDIEESPSVVALKEDVKLLNNGERPIKAYFADEMDATIHSVNDHAKLPCLSMLIVTDNHLRLGDAVHAEVNDNCLNNIAFFNRHCFVDGIAHLGDILDTSGISSFTEEEQYDAMQSYLLRLSRAAKNFYTANGNHDGYNGNFTSEKMWYSIIGRRNANDWNVTRYEGSPYQYFDHNPSKTRCIFLANPDKPNDGNLIFGFSDREITWLASVMASVPSGYNILFFSHIPAFTESGVNNSTFKGMCDAFTNHTSFSDDKVSVDFSSVTGKVLAFICGHEHQDLVCESGWSYGDYSNTFLFPIVLLDCTYWNITTSDITQSDFGGVTHGRNRGTSTEDLWTTLVYRPDEGKIYFVRFGAGNDFSIDV